jgi:TonB family protein
MSLSVLCHVALVSAAVAAAGMPPTDAQPAGGPRSELIVYAPVTEAKAPAGRRPARRSAARREGRRVAPASAFDIAAFALTSATPIELPDIGPPVEAALDLLALATGRISYDAGTDQLLDAVRGRRRAVTIRHGAYSSDMVEKQVMPGRRNPRPSYPSSLLMRGVEGRLMVLFVVDSTGRVDRKSIEFPRDAHPLFVASVRSALHRSRYLPAELDGQPVRQLVSQEFAFRIAQP